MYPIGSLPIVPACETKLLNIWENALHDLVSDKYQTPANFIENIKESGYMRNLHPVDGKEQKHFAGSKTYLDFFHKSIAPWNSEPMRSPLKA